jgi:hypothetical protein
MSEIGDEAGLICPAGHGNGHSDGLAAYLHWMIISSTGIDSSSRLLTVTAIANDDVQDRDKLGDDMVNFVKPSQDGDDIRARVCVFFAQNTSQEDRQCLRRDQQTSFFHEPHRALTSNA